MKRIGIITIPDYENYGNRLQNYASKTFLEKQNFKVDTLEMNDKDFFDYKNRARKLWLKKHKLYFIVFLFTFIKNGVFRAAHYFRFELFTRKNLSVKYFPKYTKETIDKINCNYDFIVLGSDQIWNPKVNTTPNIYFATFTDPIKKIPFAVSFGVSTLGEEKEKIQSYLKDFIYFSSREKEGKEIIEILTNKKCELLIDPTFLLTKEEWATISLKPKKKLYNGEDFVFCFFLGPKSDEYNKYINTYFSNENIVSIDSNKDNDCYRDTGPQEFLWYIKNAKYILTDSFHAVAFSIIFNKNFTCFSRLNNDLSFGGLDSRIDSLLSKFDILDCKYVKESTKTNIINFENFDNIIKNEQEKYMLYLEKVGLIN